MSALPIVSIVGRPNVGKSSLFNRILNKKVAVVDDSPGVTRDRNSRNTSWNGIKFTLVDTGGLIPTAKDTIPREIKKQVDIAIQESQAIIFLVDALSGPTDYDLLIADKLRKGNLHKVIVTVNKSESQTAYNDAINHMTLGCGEPLPISALHGKRVGDLLDKVHEIIKDSLDHENFQDEEVFLSMAVIGRPNAGKSSFVNKLLNSERMIVDNVPFTTRDAVDSIFIYQQMKLKLIDTAGLRKKSKVYSDIEYYANLRALDSVKRSDICILIIDAVRKMSEQDLKIVNHIFKMKKGIIICWNKWDLVEKNHKTFDDLVHESKNSVMEIQNIPMISISALTGQRVTKVIDMALLVKQNMLKRIKPSSLRDSINSWTRKFPHPYISSKPIRFMGVKQQKADYPHFIFYCTNPGYIASSYRRYLLNNLQNSFDFSGCPLVLSFKSVGIRQKNKTTGKRDNFNEE